MLSEAIISEAERRWPDFQGGRAITLPDGQAWWFYQPTPILRPDRSRLALSWRFGPDVAPETEATLSLRFDRILTKWAEATNDANRAAAVLEAAWFCLARNYNVTPAEFEAIMDGAKALPLSEQATLGQALQSLVVEAVSTEAEVA